MKIRKAITSDIENILKTTRACASKMREQKIFQWNEHYPNYEAFKEDVDREELFVLESKEKIIGCITISTLKDDIYNEINWLTPDEKQIYLHRLAVHPDYQGQGCAQKLMSFAEDYALDNNFLSIRLDTFSKNIRNVNFYERRGYIRLGEVFFPKQSDHPFYCYELILKK
ncbi:GNAT family N-acetyltransferase [Abyssalbus ytuae]|uniref:GNAT family N-acetyltransferase n=1 Tax=Abyssalbus ytuae TaxID=2926907 RepID=A0A9E6ZRQ8_9FLAO|nr:GNAT family N-acetyltransferase [Abyssalbus ytuae]UOB19265.1 GNAT family N-acetyltransferase [Abyssalbus ytuae]